MNKKLAIIIGIVITTILIFGGIYFNREPKIDSENNESEGISQEQDTTQNEIVDIIKSISGLQANNVEIINNPVGVKGELFAPKESILSGLDYFLEKTNNKKMEDVNIDIGDGFIIINVNYKVLTNLKTPIEVKVIPILNANKDLVLNIEDVKLLDLKMPEWIVNIALDKFIKDWFPSDGKINVEFNKGNVVINKDSLIGVNLNEISVESTGLKVYAIIDLQKVLNK